MIGECGVRLFAIGIFGEGLVGGCAEGMEGHVAIRQIPCTTFRTLTPM